MLFVDLLRLTVLLIGGAATALGAVTALAAGQESSSATLIFAGAWWTVAIVLGIVARRVIAGGRGDVTGPRLGAHRDLASHGEPGPGRVHSAVADRRVRVDRRVAWAGCFPRWPPWAPDSRSSTRSRGGIASEP